MKRQRTALEMAIREQIKFLEWAQISTDDLRDMGIYEPDLIALISPDVNSLHLVWQYADGTVQWETSDWPLDTEEYASMADWLAEELCDDARETFENGTEGTIWELCSDPSEITPETVGKFDLAQAERDYKSNLGMFRIFKSVGIE